MICNITTAGFVPAFIFFKTHVGRNMHNVKTLVKFSDFISNIRSFSAWLDDMYEASYRKEINDYLATSVDVFDLERKMQNLHRRGIV